MHDNLLSRAMASHVVSKVASTHLLSFELSHSYDPESHTPLDNQLCSALDFRY